MTLPSLNRRWLLPLLLGAWGAPALAEQLIQPPSQAESSLVGTWYGEFTHGLPVQRFLVTRHADGSFTMQAKVYESGAVAFEIHSAGRWGVSNGLYAVVTTEQSVLPPQANAQPQEVVSLYEVQALEPDRFSYRHALSQRVFHARRVSPDTQLPQEAR